MISGVIHGVAFAGAHHESFFIICQRFAVAWFFFYKILNLQISKREGPFRRAVCPCDGARIGLAILCVCISVDAAPASRVRIINQAAPVVGFGFSIPIPVVIDPSGVKRGHDPGKRAVRRIGKLRDHRKFSCILLHHDTRQPFGSVRLGNRGTHIAFTQDRVEILHFQLPLLCLGSRSIFHVIEPAGIVILTPC